VTESGEHRDIHFWAEGLSEPPCGTLEDRPVWSDVVEDVTCAECREALAGDAGDLGLQDDGPALLDDRPLA
jgi:hypothetical protein